MIFSSSINHYFYWTSSFNYIYIFIRQPWFTRSTKDSMIIFIHILKVDVCWTTLVYLICFYGFMIVPGVCLYFKGRCSLDDPRVYNASRFMLKLAEHTWGSNGGIIDNIHWTNDQFYKILKQPGILLYSHLSVFILLIKSVHKKTRNIYNLRTL